MDLVQIRNRCLRLTCHRHLQQLADPVEREDVERLPEFLLKRNVCTRVRRDQ